MKDCREELTRDIGYILSQANIPVNEMNGMRNRFIAEIDKYEILERTKEIAVQDSSSEKLLKLYLASIKIEGKSTKTIDCYGRLLFRFIHSIGKPIVDVNTFDIRAWLVEVQNTTSLRTCENYRSYLSAFYNWLAVEGFVSVNPMLKIKPIKYEDVVRKGFTDVEIDSIRGGCTTLRQRAEVELLLSSGARISELCSLDRSDVNLETKEVLIRNGKGGKQRKTFMSEVCAHHLEKYLESRKDDLSALFTSSHSTRLKKGSIEAELKKLGKKVMVQNVHPHRFRRTFATSLSENGMDVSSIQRLMGHANINTTTEYISISENRIKNEYQRYN